MTEHDSSQWNGAARDDGRQKLERDAGGEPPSHTPFTVSSLSSPKSAGLDKNP